MPRYICIPASHTATWRDIFEYAETLGVYGNDFIGSKQYNAKSGKIVFKLDI